MEVIMTAHSRGGRVIWERTKDGVFSSSEHDIVKISIEVVRQLKFRSTSGLVAFARARTLAIMAVVTPRHSVKGSQWAKESNELLQQVRDGGEIFEERGNRVIIKYKLSGIDKLVPEDQLRAKYVSEPQNNDFDEK